MSAIDEPISSEFVSPNSALVAFSLILSGFISCNEKPKKDIIITKMPPKTEISKNPLQVGDYSQSREVEWVGSTYTVEVNRKADSTLPKLFLSLFLISTLRPTNAN